MLLLLLLLVRYHCFNGGAGFVPRRHAGSA